MGRKFAFEVGRIAKLPSYELDQLFILLFRIASARSCDT
jgi:hypothetical protein